MSDPAKVSKITTTDGVAHEINAITVNDHTVAADVPSTAVFTDEKVTQTESTTNNNYEVTFAGSTGTTTSTEGVGKSQYFTYNPSKKAFTLGTRASNQTVGNYSQAQGTNTAAMGNNSHAEGIGAWASGNNSHAEGSGTEASGTNSHAEGINTYASGEGSHAEGNRTTASGYSSHAEGTNTTANHAYQRVFGRFNIADPSTADATAIGNYVEIVGNGTRTAYSNARTLDWDGNEVLAGNLTLGGTSSDIALSGTGNTWDGNHTSLKGALTPVVVFDSTVNLNNYTSSGRYILTGASTTRTNFPHSVYVGMMEVVTWFESDTEGFCRQDFKIYNAGGTSSNIMCSRIGRSTNGGSSWSWPSPWYSADTYLPGEELTFGSGYPGYGFITSSTTEMHIYFPAPKNMMFASGSTAPDSITCTIRQNGKYIGTDFGSTTVFRTNHYRQKNIFEYVGFNNSSGTGQAWKNATNNCEISVIVNNPFTVTFT